MSCYSPPVRIVSHVELWVAHARRFFHHVGRAPRGFVIRRVVRLSKGVELLLVGPIDRACHELGFRNKHEPAPLEIDHQPNEDHDTRPARCTSGDKKIRVAARPRHLDLTFPPS